MNISVTTKQPISLAKTDVNYILFHITKNCIMPNGFAVSQHGQNICFLQIRVLAASKICELGVNL